MPKTSTGNKRASSASTKKSGLKKRFDLTNRKVQFFVVIAIVAVLGGGWFTVRSFAASNTWYYNLSNRGLKPVTYAGGPCGANPMTDTEKNRTNVVGVLCQAGKPTLDGQQLSSSLKFQYGGAQTTNAYFGTWAVGRYIRTCALIRATTPTATVRVQQQGLVDAIGLSIITTQLSKGGYTNVCTPQYEKIYKPGNTVHSAFIVPQSGAPTAAYIAEIKIEMQ